MAKTETVYDTVKKLKNIAENRRMKLRDFNNAIVDFFNFNEDKIFIIDGKIYCKEIIPESEYPELIKK